MTKWFGESSPKNVFCAISNRKSELVPSPKIQVSLVSCMFPLSAMLHKQSIHWRLYTKHIRMKMSNSLWGVVSVVTGHKQEYNPGALWQGF